MRRAAPRLGPGFTFPGLVEKCELASCSCATALNTPYVAPKYGWGFCQPQVPNPHNIPEQVLMPRSRLPLTFCRCHSFLLVSCQCVSNKVLKPTTRITSLPSSLLHANPVSPQCCLAAPLPTHCLLCPHPLPHYSEVIARAPQSTHECMWKQEGREIGLLQSSAAAQSSKQLWLCNVGARIPSFLDGR